MISVKFAFSKNGICGFEVSGHATVDENDVLGLRVCAAVSSAAYMAANTVTDVIGDRCEISEKDGFMKLYCETPSAKTVSVLEGFKLHITELKKQYGKRIKITEV